MFNHKIKCINYFSMILAKQGCKLKTDENAVKSCSAHALVVFGRVCVRSRCWDACMVVDGGTSFEFNDGAIATISLNEEDLLRTVILD